MFITLEGIDGCGKSTQARRLHALMLDAGIDSMLNVDPGGTELGKRLRQLVLDPTIDMDPWVQALVFTAARADAAKRIRRHIDAGGTAISDRWGLSTIVYQCIAQGIDRKLIDTVTSSSFLYGVSPSLQIIMSIEPITAFERREARSGPPTIGNCTAPSQAACRKALQDRFESKGAEFFAKLHAGYQSLGSMPNTVVVDVEGFSEEVVTSMLVSIIVEHEPRLAKLAEVVGTA